MNTRREQRREGPETFRRISRMFFFLSEGSVRYCSAASTSYPKMHRLVWFFQGNSNTLTGNYGGKQGQFIKPTSELCARNPKEFNETFDRAIRGRLLQHHCSQSSINYRHQIRREQLHTFLKKIYKQTSFRPPCMRDSLLEKRAHQEKEITKQGLI